MNVTFAFVFMLPIKLKRQAGHISNSKRKKVFLGTAVGLLVWSYRDTQRTARRRNLATKTFCEEYKN